MINDNNNININNNNDNNNNNNNNHHHHHKKVEIKTNVLGLARNVHSKFSRQWFYDNNLSIANSHSQFTLANSQFHFCSSSRTSCLLGCHSYVR